MTANRHSIALKELLGAQILAGQQLQTTLQQEFTALQSRDPAAIEQAVAAKQNCLKQFAELEQQRSRILPLAPGQSLDDFLAHHGLNQDVDLTNLLTELRQIAANCQQQNLVNGGIVDLGKRHAERSLEIICGKPADQTYGPAGNTSRKSKSSSLAVA